MAIKRPDIYEHNNPVLSIADSNFVRGGGRVVADLTALYALSSNSDQLKERVTKVWVTAESAYYILVDDANIGNSNGWEEETGGGGGTWGSITGTLSDQTDLQTALDGKVDENAAITGATKTKITYDSKGLVTAGADLSASDLPTGIDATKIADGTVTNAEFQYLGSVTSDIQTQLNSKQATITGAATTIDTEDLTASRALVSDGSGKVAVSSVTSTELGYLSGVTSAIQTQVDTKTAKLITTNRQTASYTLVLSDADKLVEMNVASANNLTVPASVFPAGTQILLAQYGTGQTTVVAGSGMTIRSNGGKLKLNVQYSGATLVFLSGTEAYLFGDIVS